LLAFASLLTFPLASFAGRFLIFAFASLPLASFAGRFLTFPDAVLASNVVGVQIGSSWCYLASWCDLACCGFCCSGTGLVLIIYRLLLVGSFNQRSQFVFRWASQASICKRTIYHQETSNEYTDTPHVI
jgi:hypothetical protein